MPGTRKKPQTQSDQYQITVRGVLDNTWPEWLGSLQMSTTRDSTGEEITFIEGSFRDQAALRGVLVKLWDLNVILLDVGQINPHTEGLPTKRRIEK